jgi:hypothetical protein
VIGPALLLVGLLIALPVSFFGVGLVLSAIIGWALKTNGEQTHENSELLETNY